MTDTASIPAALGANVAPESVERHSGPRPALGSNCPFAVSATTRPPRDWSPTRVAFDAAGRPAAGSGVHVVAPGPSRQSVPFSSVT